MIRPFAVLTLACLGLSACTWIKMEPEAARVRVLSSGASVSHCTAKGEISVSVRDRIGLYQRNDLKVRDELETLARNEAPGLGADTIQALEEPAMGEQRFAAFRCGSAAPAPRPAPRAEAGNRPAASSEAAETFPIPH